MKDPYPERMQEKGHHKVAVRVYCYLLESIGVENREFRQVHDLQPLPVQRKAGEVKLGYDFLQFLQREAAAEKSAKFLITVVHKGKHERHLPLRFPWPNISTPQATVFLTASCVVWCYTVELKFTESSVR